MMNIFQHTPIWVWVLFAFLLYRGIQALYPRNVNPVRMLLLPVVFLIWAVVSIEAELQKLWLGYTGFVIGLVFGFGVGWMMWRTQKRCTFNRTTRTVRRPGSPWTLILILVAFSTKFILHVFLAQSPTLHHDPTFHLLFGGISGFVDGVFWGGTALQLQSLRTRGAEITMSEGQ